MPTSTATGAPIAILLFNLGGPGTLADVRPFLINLFSDRDIIELPLGALLQPVVARIIAASRGPSVRENYARIGGGSPQLRLTGEQAAALEARLNRQGGRVRTFIAMRYWQPTTEQALEAMAAEGISRVVTLTLFPHYSQATTGSSEKELARTLALPKWQGRFTVTGIRSYPDDPLYLDAMTDTVRRALDGLPGRRARASRAALQRARIAAEIHRPRRSLHRGDRQDPARHPRAAATCRTVTCSGTSREPAR